MIHWNYQLSESPAQQPEWHSVKQMPCVEEAPFIAIKPKRKLNKTYPNPLGFGFSFGRATNCTHSQKPST